MPEPTEWEYFKWLCARVLDIKNRQYYDLCRELYTTPFIWVIIGDGNRAAEGVELRDDFLSETGLYDDGWYSTPCSVLEVLIAFANRAAFQTDMPVREWFFIFLRNLNLDEYRQFYAEDVPSVQEILNTFMYRVYRSNGVGGMFPMQRTRNDQRVIEIWYQFCEYLEDQGYI